MISKQGSTWLRWILCEAAQTAKRHPDFAETYAGISRRRGKKIATTAIARKLLTRAYHLLVEAEAEAEAAAGPPIAPSRRRPSPSSTKSRVSSQNRMGRPTSRAR